MTSESVVWHVKLPAEWKEIFEKVAEEEGDTEHGAASRAFRKAVRKQVAEVGA